VSKALSYLREVAICTKTTDEQHYARFPRLRLSGMIRASSCEDIVFVHIANTLRNKRLLTPEA